MAKQKMFGSMTGSLDIQYDFKFNVNLTLIRLTDHIYMNTVPA